MNNNLSIEKYKINDLVLFKYLESDKKTFIGRIIEYIHLGYNEVHVNKYFYIKDININRYTFILKTNILRKINDLKLFI